MPTTCTNALDKMMPPTTTEMLPSGLEILMMFMMYLQEEIRLSHNAPHAKQEGIRPDHAIHRHETGGAVDQSE